MSDRKDTYISPFSTRYASSEMQQVFSENFKFRTWRRLWISLAKAEQKLGLDITDEQIAQLEQFKDDINYDKDIIFQEEHDYRYNFRREITNTFDKLGELIAYDFTTDKVFYQDNMTGDSINSYLKWCG